MRHRTAWLLVLQAATAKKHNVSLTIAFTSDLHGEIAPLKHAAALYDALPGPKLLVDSGDAFVGTGYFWRAGPAGMGRVLKSLGYAVLGVGNHDLELASSFRNFSATANAPLVSTNLCGHYPGIKCSTTVDAGDICVGFVGYCDTSSLGPAEWRSSLPKGSCDDKMMRRVIDEAISLRRSVDVVIALGHCGFDFDVTVAKTDVIDAVLGGHTHLIKHRSNYGKNPVVLQAGNLASHLGILTLDLVRRRNNTTIVAARGAMRPLDKKHRHSLIDGELKHHAAPHGKPPWRRMSRGADAGACRTSECALGNLVADAMARSGACRGLQKVPLIALIEAGSVRGVVREGPFGRDEATNILPWANHLVVLRFPSIQALEELVAYGARSRPVGGGFLQASANARIVLDAHHARVFVRPFDCGTTSGRASSLTFDDATVPSACATRGFTRPPGPVDVIVTSWLVQGGDGFDVRNATRRKLEPAWLKDVDALRRHVASLPADAIIRREGRLSVVDNVEKCAPPSLPKRAPPLIAGLLGAFSMMSSFVATYPLSTLQTRAMLGEPLGLQEGCAPLYRGVALAAVAVYASGAVFWTAHEFLSSVAGAGHAGGEGRKAVTTFFFTFIAGALNVLATNPLWVAVTRLQGGLSALPSMAERSSRFCWPCAGILPNTVLVLFPTLRQTIYEGLLRCVGSDPLSAGPWLISLAVALATLIAATATHPLQWYRSRLQAGHGTHASRNKARASVWDGLSIKLVHTVLSNTLMYLSKEQLTQFVLKTFLE